MFSLLYCYNARDGQKNSSLTPETCHSNYKSCANCQANTPEGVRTPYNCGISGFQGCCQHARFDPETTHCYRKDNIGRIAWLLQCPVCHNTVDVPASADAANGCESDTASA